MLPWSRRRSSGCSAESQSEIAENVRVHELLVDGGPVEHRGPDGQVRTAYVRLIDFDNPGNNDWPAVSQLTIVPGKNRRLDGLVFGNDIPLALLELKNPADLRRGVRASISNKDTISQITGTVVAEMQAWTSRWLQGVVERKVLGCVHI